MAKIASMIRIFISVLCVSNAISQVIQEETDYLEIRCLVCQQIMKQIQNAISKVNPEIKIEVGNYRLDSQNPKTVQYRTSEGYLTELTEKICDKMDNFVKAKHRETGEILVIPLLTESGQMNTIMSEVDVIQDETLNKNLKLYCEDIIENYDELMIKHLKSNEDQGLDSLDKKICGLVCENVSPESEIKDEL